MTHPDPSARTPWRPLAASAALATVAALAAVGAPSSTLAQLADPTRAPYVLPRNAMPNPAGAGPAALGNTPPGAAALMRPAGVPAGASPSDPSREAPARAAPPVKPRPRLTSVMLGRGAVRSVAIIDGEVFQVGDKVQGTTLTAIDATGVLLGSGKGAQRLSLFARQAEAAATVADPVKDKKGSDPAAPAAPGQPTAAPVAMPPGSANANAFPSLQNGARPDKDTP